jgi:glucose-1-phosphate thymidylyltransferase
MKGVVLAGGLGTRLYPLTHVTNKHLLPIYNKPMIFYPIETLVKAGITDILVVTSGPYVSDFLRILKDGAELGAEHLEFSYQKKPDGGIADALRRARDFVGAETFTVILGDNIIDDDISAAARVFENGAHVFLKRVTNTQEFGIAEFDYDEPQKIIRIEEKPQLPKSDMAVTGLYMYDEQIFHFIDQLKPSQRNQFEITDVNNMYIAKSQLYWSELQGFWKDAGSFESLFLANQYWAYKCNNL